MPSDARTPQVLDALSESIGTFRSALANTSEQIRLLLGARPGENGSAVDCARAELGQFAAGRIDPQRMSNLFTRGESLELADEGIVRKALDTCNELLARKENLFRVVVEPGGDIRERIGERLAVIGRAFGATRVVDLVSQGQYYEAEHASLLDRHPFERWSRTERAVAPPLVAPIAGSDLHPAGLADFLDGSLKLVLIVQGEAPPAALVRLISPGVLILQTSEAAQLCWLAGFSGPAVAALVSSSAVHFRHDPAGGPDLADRIEITKLEDRAPAMLGAWSVFQQQQDLEQLQALAALGTEPERAERASKAVEPPAPTPPPAKPAQPAKADPADKLSAWLLRQTDLSDPS